MPKPKLIVIVGPTAAGKTDYSLVLAKKLNGAVISADSRQVYRGMDIGTAKVQDTQGIPHYLLDVREPNDPMTLPEWQQAAFHAIDEILAQGKQPILVGGTMLYVDSVVFNYEIPRVTPDLHLRAELAKHLTLDLYQKLLAKDPGARKFIEPGNTRRIIRALEVIDATGKPFSAQRRKREAKYNTEITGLFSSWEELKNKIERRAREMFEEGLLDEMKALRQKFGRNLPLLKTQNYRQAGAVLDGKMSQEEAIADMVKADLRYARRQMSWWRERKEIRWTRLHPGRVTP